MPKAVIRREADQGWKSWDDRKLKARSDHSNEPGMKITTHLILLLFNVL